MERHAIIGHQISRRIEAMRIKTALLKADLTLRGFNPDQPRMPAAHRAAVRGLPVIAKNFEGFCP